MSILDRIGNNLEHLPDLIEQYSQLIDEEQLKKEIAIRGKVLEHANSEQASLLFYYSSRKEEIKTILRHVSNKVTALRGKHYRNYTEHYSRELNDRQKDKYIDNESDVVMYNEVLCRIEELYGLYDAVVEAFKQRGFSLRNITESRVRSVENSIID